MTFPLDAGGPGASVRAAPGGRMLRVTAWTVGLFGAGAAIAHAFPGRWVQPIVLLALGLAFLFVSARRGAVKAPRPVAKLPARAVAAAAPARAPAPATASVPVEQSASV